MDQDARRTQPPRRLLRSSRERMWAGVAGGLAEYFDVDPVVVRLIWVAATVLSGGLTIPLYIALWIIMPREDQVDPSRSYDNFRDGSRQFADEARRVADDVASSVRTAWYGGPTAPTPPSAATAEAAEGKGVGVGATEEPVAAASTKAEEPSAPPSSESYEQGYGYDYGYQPGRHWGGGHGLPRRQRTAGFILVALGGLILLGNLGVFRAIPWHIVWPVIIVGLGVALLFRGQERRW